MLTQKQPQPPTMSLSQHLASLNDAINRSAQWVPYIPLKSSHFMTSSDGSIIENSTRKFNQVNLSLFITPEISSPEISSSAVHLAICNFSFHYPKNAVIQIEGFVGLDKENEVVNLLKGNAAMHGTTLTSRNRKVQE